MLEATKPPSAPAQSVASASPEPASRRLPASVYVVAVLWIWASGLVIVTVMSSWVSGLGTWDGSLSWAPLFEIVEVALAAAGGYFAVALLYARPWSRRAVEHLTWLWTLLNAGLIGNALRVQSQERNVYSLINWDRLGVVLYAGELVVVCLFGAFVILVLRSRSARAAFGTFAGHAQHVGRTDAWGIRR